MALLIISFLFYFKRVWKWCLYIIQTNAPTHTHIILDGSEDCRKLAHVWSTPGRWYKFQKWTKLSLNSSNSNYTYSYSSSSASKTEFRIPKHIHTVTISHAQIRIVNGEGARSVHEEQPQCDAKDQETEEELDGRSCHCYSLRRWDWSD